MDLWRNLEPRPRERSRELPPIDVPHTVGQGHEGGWCLDRQIRFAALRLHAGRAGEKQDQADYFNSHRMGLITTSSIVLPVVLVTDMRGNTYPIGNALTNA